ncbi:hypothetical protein [Thioclava sp. GXIMD4216]|uniref:hypothetical protein n=1 Tax=unclassified Thioclava TaxID=2621713 RepID=UPI0030D2899E
MSRKIMSLLGLLVLSACVVDENGHPVFATRPTGPSMDQAGTCFLYVEDAKDGTYNLVNGIGNGTKTPLATRQTGLDAAALDAAWAKERKIMDINPECLAISARDRSAARPVSG